MLLNLSLNELEAVKLAGLFPVENVPPVLNEPLQLRLSEDEYNRLVSANIIAIRQHDGSVICDGKGDWLKGAADALAVIEAQPKAQKARKGRRKK